MAFAPSPLNSYAQFRADKNGLIWQPAGGVFAIEGTVYPGAPNPVVPLTDNDDEGWWAGFASGTIGGLINIADGLWYVESVGYPAVTTPMWPSAQIGQHNLGFSIKNFADWYHDTFGYYPPISVVAWSQGAIAADLLWTVDVLPESGYLHYLKDFIYRIYNYGDPLRCPEISMGDTYAGLPGPGTEDGQITGGVGGPQDLRPEQTLISAPDGKNVIISFNNHGDLYGAAPMGKTPWNSMPASGKVEYSFFKIIMQPGFLNVVEVGLDLFHPIGDIQAAGNAIKFFGAAQNAPHYHYEQAMAWVIGDLVALGGALPHQLGV
jgi:hypothetical protein